MKSAKKTTILQNKAGKRDIHHSSGLLEAGREVSSWLLPSPVETAASPAPHRSSS